MSRTSDRVGKKAKIKRKCQTMTRGARRRAQKSMEGRNRQVGVCRQCHLKDGHKFSCSCRDGKGMTIPLSMIDDYMGAREYLSGGSRDGI